MFPRMMIVENNGFDVWHFVADVVVVVAVVISYHDRKHDDTMLFITCNLGQKP